MRDFPDYRQLRYIEHLILKDITRDLKYKTLELCTLLEKKESELSGVDRETLSKLREIISDYENAKANMEKLSKETLAEFEKMLDKFMNESDVTEFIKEHFSTQIEGLVETALIDAKNSGEFDGASITITNITESDNDGGYNIVTFSDGSTLRIRNGVGGSGSGGEVVKNYYTVISNLTNVTSSSDVTEVEENASYSATLTTAGTMESVVITMGGEDITATVYDSATGEINISAVTGHINITASAVLDETKIYYTITHNLTNVTASSNVNQVEEGKSYSVTLTPSESYTMQSVVVRMGGTDITSTVYTSGTGTILIPSVTGDVTITASAELVVNTYSVTYNLGDHVLVNQDPREINEGEPLEITFIFQDGYELQLATFKMGGVDINNYFNSETLTLSIPAVTGDVIITVQEQEVTTGTYTNIISSLTLSEGKRWDWSGKTAVDATNHVQTSMFSIPTDGATLYFKNIPTAEGTQRVVACFGSYIGDFEGGTYIEIADSDANATWWSDGSLKSYKLPSSFNGKGTCSFQCISISDDSILTINEPIP